MLIVAAIMLAAAPAMASGPGPGTLAPTAIAQAMREMAADDAASHRFHHAMPAHCLASCLAATALTSPAALRAGDAPAAMHSAPPPNETGTLLAHRIAVEPPPPRLS